MGVDIAYPFNQIANNFVVEVLIITGDKEMFVSWDER